MSFVCVRSVRRALFGVKLCVCVCVICISHTYPYLSQIIDEGTGLIKSGPAVPGGVRNMTQCAVVGDYLIVAGGFDASGKAIGDVLLMSTV